MSSKIVTTPQFTRLAKKLAKKYRSLKTDLRDLSEELLENPHMGTLIGENLYKVRFAIKSKGRGKSGGGRLITFVDLLIEEKEEITHIVLLTIYDKSAKATLKDADIQKALQRYQKFKEEE
ncbi:MAG: hypothetical protein AAFZ52_06850 [Bacteroidota bacterium]